MNDEAREIAAGRKLHELIARDENLGPRIRQMMKTMSARDILRELTGEDNSN